jgi:hypothetical protein
MDKNKLRSLLNEGKTQNALDSLLEELETKTSKKTNSELKNSDTHTEDSYNEFEETKEIIVESENLSAKEKMSLLLEKYGVSSMKELADEERARFLKELNDPETKFVKPNVLLEEETPPEMNAKAELMKQKRLAKQDGPKSARISGEKVNAEVESPEDDQVDAEEDILEPVVQANDKDVVDEKSKKDDDTKDKKGDDTIKTDKKLLTKDENIDSVNESLESIFDILRDMKSLREDEVTDKGDAAAEPVATNDTDGETKEPDTDNKDVYSKEEHEEKEEVKEIVVENNKAAIQVQIDQLVQRAAIASGTAAQDNINDQIKRLEAQKAALTEEVTDKGDAAAKPEATKEGEGSSQEPKEDNAGIYPSDEHEEKEEVKEIVVETGDKLEVSNPVEQQYEVEKEIAPSDAPEPTVKTTVKGGEVKVDKHDHSDEEGKKVRAEVIEEEVTSKGEVAKTDNEATKEGDGKSEEPKDDNKDTYPDDEHKEKEEVEEVVVEDAIEVSDDSIYLTLPIRENEKFVEEFSDKEQEIIAEALKEVYGVFIGKKINEDFEVPSSSEADLKVYKEKIEIEIPITNPSESITESDAARLKEALEVLDAILKEMSTAGIAAPDVAAGGATKDITKKAVEGKNDPENADQVDNEDLYGDDSEQEDDVKEVVVEAEDKKELPEALKKNMKDDKDADDVPEALEDDSPDEDNSEKDKKADKKDKEEDSKDDEDKSDDKKEDKDEELKEEKVLNPAEEKEKTKKDSDCEVEPEVKNGEVSVKPHDAADEEGKKVRSEIIEESEDKKEEKEPKSTEEVNDAGSDTVNSKGELEDPAADEKNDEKAQPEDVTKGYKSIKEAFLLETDYFSKDSNVLLTADEKRTKLENQMSLLIARESQDPLYEELVRTTILAKKLQEQLHDRYGEDAKAKSQELVNLKENKDPDDDQDSSFIMTEEELQNAKELIDTLVKLAEGDEELLEGVLSKFKGKALALIVRFLPEKSLDKIIQKANVAAMKKALNQNEQVKAKIQQEFPSVIKGGKKEKIQYIRNLIAKSPESAMRQANTQLDQIATKVSKEKNLNASYEEILSLEMIFNEAPGGLARSITRINGGRSRAIPAGLNGGNIGSKIGTMGDSSFAVDSTMGGFTGIKNALERKTTASIAKNGGVAVIGGGSAAATTGGGFLASLATLTGPQGIIVGIIATLIVVTVTALVTALVMKIAQSNSYIT